MMKAPNNLYVKVSSCNGMSLVSMLHHKDRFQCLHHAKSPPLQVSLFFLIFPYFSSFFTLVQLL